jgi:hypothetical protein
MQANSAPFAKGLSIASGFAAITGVMLSAWRRPVADDSEIAHCVSSY